MHLIAQIPTRAIFHLSHSTYFELFLACIKTVSRLSRMYGFGSFDVRT